MGAIDRGLRSITRPANPGAAAIGLIGNTPLVEVTRMDAGLCRLFVKLEGANPGGSIKDRPALTMVEALEKRGPAGARRHAGRSDRRQHRPRPGRWWRSPRVIG